MLTSIGCLVAVMYFEARNQPVDTMLGVGQVLIEHARPGENLCHVIERDPGLFTWARHGMKIPHPKSKADKEVLDKQYELARKMLFRNLRTTKLTEGYKHFNNVPLGKRFRTKVKMVKIGDLLFF